MNNNKQQLLNWNQQGYISSNNLDKALSLIDSKNTKSDWFKFISKLILSLSVIATACGIIFFFAYNWEDLSKFSKFALIQGLMIISLYAYVQTKDHSLVNSALLFFLTLLVGALFALFGQTYQTGKDPWQLFAMWTLFITPLAYVSKNTALWIFWLVLLNTTAFLFLNIRHGLLGLVFSSERNFLFMALLNVIAAVLFSILYRHTKINSKIITQIALLAAMFAFSWVAIYSTFGISNHGIDLMIYIAWMAGVYYLYRIRNIDVLILSSWVVSGIIFTISMIAKTIDNDLDGGMFLVLGILILSLSAVGGKWLIGLHRQLDSNLKLENNHG